MNIYYFNTLHCYVVLKSKQQYSTVLAWDCQTISGYRKHNPNCTCIYK